MTPRRFNKKNIPIIILSIAVVVSIIIACVVFSRNKHNNNGQVIENTEENERTFIDGIIPAYANVPKNKYDKDLFVTNDNSRISYNGKKVKAKTGIDVSTYQETIDWKKVKNDNIDFVFIRIGGRGYGEQGVLYADDNWRINVDEAKDAGLDVGVYFYSQATNTDEAVEEARFCLKQLKDEKLTYPVVFDWENESDYAMRTDNVSGSTLTDCAVAFCDEIKAEGYMPMVYFNMHSAYTKYDLSRLTDYYIWYSEYETDHPNFYYNFDIWQYTCTGRVDGIDGNVDINISFLDF